MGILRQKRGYLLREVAWGGLETQTDEACVAAAVWLLEPLF